jgi:hypothetical protein
LFPQITINLKITDLHNPSSFCTCSFVAGTHPCVNPETNKGYSRSVLLQADKPSVLSGTDDTKNYSCDFIPEYITVKKARDLGGIYSKLPETLDKFQMMSNRILVILKVDESESQ